MLDVHVYRLLWHLTAQPNGTDWRKTLVDRFGEPAVWAAEVSCYVQRNGGLSVLLPAGTAALIVEEGHDAA